MTNNWLNTKAGQRFANHTIPDLTAAINRVGDLLDNQTNDLKSKETPRPLRDYFMEKDREYLEKEISQVMTWEPTQLEILLYRALSHLYEDSNATEEAHFALATASWSWRNILVEHTFVPEDEDDTLNQRIEWEYQEERVQ